jgi:cell division protease FtsH
MLDQAYHESKEIISQHRDQLERVASALLEKETLDADQFQQLLGRTDAAADTSVTKAS